MTAPKLTYSTRNLNDDCSEVAAGTSIAERAVESAELLEKLRSFAAIPAVDFIEVDASLSLKGKGVEFLVTNEGGQLFMVQAPAVKNSPVQRSPEEIVQFLDDEFSPSSAAPEEEELVLRPNSTRDKVGSPKMLIGLVAIWAIIAYVTLAPEGIENVTMVDDAAREANFAQQIEGRYGNAEPGGVAVFVVKNGRFQVFLNSADGLDTEPSLDQAYSFGHRDGELVLVVENGAVLSRNAVGALVFEDEVYPRIP